MNATAQASATAAPVPVTTSPRYSNGECDIKYEQYKNMLHWWQYYCHRRYPSIDLDEIYGQLNYIYAECVHRTKLMIDAGGNPPASFSTYLYGQCQGILNWAEHWSRLCVLDTNDEFEPFGSQIPSKADFTSGVYDCLPVLSEIFGETVAVVARAIMDGYAKIYTSSGRLHLRETATIISEHLGIAKDVVLDAIRTLLGSDRDTMRDILCYA
jgi:hypothetical protein